MAIDKIGSKALVDCSVAAADIAPGTITGTQLAGSIANAKLANSTVTINGTAIALGASASINPVSWQSVVVSDGSTVTTMVAGRGYFVNNTSAAGIVKLPISASAGDTVAIKDYAGNFATNNLTIQRNGHNIQGVANDSSIQTNRASLQLVYIDATKGWLYTNESNVDDLENKGYTTATGGTVTTSGDFKIHTFTGDGNFVVSQGPIQFVKDTVSTEVEIDTAVPANNEPLPVGMYVNKDGVLYPVTKDTATPANTVSIPVEIVGTAGTEINITAGDINVQLTHLGANFDSTRVGDGTNLMGVNADNEALVHDAEVHTKLDTGNASLASIDTKMDAQATAANQATGNASLASINTKMDAQATAANQATGNASLASIDGKLNSLGIKGSAASVPVALSTEQQSTLTAIGNNTNGNAREAKQDTMITNQGTMITNQGLALAELQKISAVKDVVDVIPPIDINSTNIPASSSNPLEIIGATTAAVTKVQTIEDVGEYIGLYSGAATSEVLIAILPIAGGEVDVSIPLGTRLSIRHMKNTAISTDTFFAANLVG